MRVSVPLRQSVLPLHGMREKTIVLFVFDCYHKPEASKGSLLKLQESSLEHCPCAFHWKTLHNFHLSVGFLSFLTLGDCSSFHHFALDSEVSSSHHQTNRKFYSHLQSWIKLVCRLFRTVSWPCRAKTVWSWTESCSFDLYNLPRIGSEGISLGDGARSHVTSNSWTSSFCQLTLITFESPCTTS